jgi:RecB family endonuclease NucS
MAFFTFKPEAIGQAEFLPAQDLVSAGIKESVLRDLLVLHLHQLDVERRLMVLACEYIGWSDANRCIDLLAIDEDQNLVVVELKRTKHVVHPHI